MQIQASTANLVLKGLTKTGHPDYLGTPPDEVAKAYGDLTEAAEAADFWENSPVECPGKNCGRDAFKFETAWKELGAALVAWEPWL